MTEAASPYTRPRPRWRALPAEDPSLATVNEARLQLHWAAQLPSAASRALLPKRDDESHTNLGWLPGLGGLVTRALTRHAGSRVALDVGEFSLRVLGPESATLARLELDGQTLASALAWLRDALAGETRRAVPALALADYDMPAAPPQTGAPLARPSDQHLSILRDLYANSHAVLTEISRRRAGASPVRCWPHHFDIATLISLDGGDPERARSIGVGMSPGDTSYDAPYFYVSPWPYPKADAELPELFAGDWHREGFTAAVLRYRSIVSDPEPGAQPVRVRDFLSAAIAAAEDLLT